MQPHEPIQFTTRDRLMRAWQNSMEAVRDYKLYANEISDPAISALFDRSAEEVGHQAAAFHDLLQNLPERTN